MKTQRYLIACVGLLLVIVGCQSTLPGVLSAEDAGAIAELDERFRQSILEGDWATFAELYSDSAVLMPPNASAVIGRQAIVDWFSGVGLQISAFTGASASIEGTEDLAYNRGAYSLTFTPPGAADPMTEKGKYLWIVRKGANGVWRIGVDIWNSDAPTPNPDSE